MDRKDTQRIARAVAARTVRRLARDVGTGVDARAAELESCLRTVVTQVLDAGRPARPDHLLTLCRDLRMTRGSFDALGHHLLTTLLPHRVGPDALIRVGALLTDVRGRLAPEEVSSPNGGPPRRDRPAANSAARRYRRERLPEHLPSTPGWECTACGTDWPCPTKQSQLLAEFGGASAGLAVYLGSCLVAAVQDLPTMPLSRARNRFLGWLPRNRF
ncbi:hypothetical protein [Micromonospora sp. NPDC126480]|uniref:hypothetical protein n=1 Tax=Micromonospora sp. NPDC126480 TaxID=3155312 RepID=UPI003320670D